MDEKTTGGNSRWPENNTQQHTAADGGRMMADGGCFVAESERREIEREVEIEEREMRVFSLFLVL